MFEPPAGGNVEGGEVRTLVCGVYVHVHCGWVCLRVWVGVTVGSEGRNVRAVIKLPQVVATVALCVHLYICCCHGKACWSWTCY